MFNLLFQDLNANLKIMKMRIGKRPPTPLHQNLVNSCVGVMVLSIGISMTHVLQISDVSEGWGSFSDPERIIIYLGETYDRIGKH